MNQITVVGNAVADLSFDLPRQFLKQADTQQAISLPFGSKLPAERYYLTAGGSGANVAVGLHHGGLKTKFLTGFSVDHFGQFLKKIVEKAGVELESDEYEEPSHLSIILRIKGERTIITTHADNYQYLDRPLPSTGWLHIGPLPPSQDRFYQRLVSHAAQTSQLFSFNPSIEILRERSRQFLLALRLAKIVFVNQEEAAVLTRLSNRTPAEELVRAIRRMGVAIVCVTAGQKGAYVGSPAGTWFTPATTNSTNRVDATGAGDGFTSGFLLGYLDPELTDEKQLIRRALAFGALNAGSVVGQVGGQSGLLTREELVGDERTVTLKEMEES